jgi:hypothetical protein
MRGRLQADRMIPVKNTPVEIRKELPPDFHRTEKPLGGNLSQNLFEFPPDCLKSLHTNRLP